jgi:hypothetical protein
VGEARARVAESGLSDAAGPLLGSGIRCDPGALLLNSWAYVTCRCTTSNVCPFGIARTSPAAALHNCNARPVISKQDKTCHEAGARGGWPLHAVQRLLDHIRRLVSAVNDIARPLTLLGAVQHTCSGNTECHRPLCNRRMRGSVSGWGRAMASDQQPAHLIVRSPSGKARGECGGGRKRRRVTASSDIVRVR